MQKIWSRVAQTRSCNCTSCIHHTRAAVSRRATPSTLAAARSRLSGHLLTLCYTSTLATAAVLDMHVKKERSDNWDQLIRETKGEDQETTDKDDMQEYVQDDVPDEDTAEIEESAPPKKMKLPLRRPLTLPALRHDRGWKRGWNIPPLDYEASLNEQLELLGLFIDRAITKTDFVSIRGRLRPSQGHTDISEETSETISYDPRNPERRPKNAIHLQCMQDTISRLVANVLMTHRSVQSSQSGKPQDPVEEQRIAQMKVEMQEKIASLSSQYAGLPSYNLASHEEAESGLHGLNKALSLVFQASGKGSDIVVIQICYNMLISPIAPNITSYNILILNFLKRGLFDLSQVVVDSFFNDCRLRPNEETIAVMLHHYIARNDQKGFDEMIQKMRGMNGSLRIKSRRIAQLHNDPVYRWASTSKVIHREDFLYEKAPRDQLIFHKLLLGTCVWQAAKRAVMFTRAMVREGYHLSTPILQMLVRAIIFKDELGPARNLLRFILKVWTWDQGTDNYELKILSVSADARFVIRELMSFCGIELSRDMQIEKFMGWLFIPEERDGLCRLARGLYLESLEDDFERAEIRTLGLLRRIAPDMYSYNPFQTASIASQLQVEIEEGWLNKSRLSCLKSAYEFLSKRLETEERKESRLPIRDQIEAALVKRAYQIALDGWEGKEYRRRRRWLMHESEIDWDGNPLPDKTAEEEMDAWLDKKIERKRGWFLGPPGIDRGLQGGCSTGPPSKMEVFYDRQSLPGDLAKANQAQDLGENASLEHREKARELSINESEMNVEVEKLPLSDESVGDNQSSIPKDMIEGRSARAKSSPSYTVRCYTMHASSRRTASSTAHEEGGMMNEAEHRIEAPGRPPKLTIQYYYGKPSEPPPNVNIQYYYKGQAISPRGRKFANNERSERSMMQKEDIREEPSNLISQSSTKPTSSRIEGSLEHEVPAVQSMSMAKDRTEPTGTPPNLISRYYGRPTRLRIRKHMGYEEPSESLPPNQVSHYFAETALSQLKSRLKDETRIERRRRRMREMQTELEAMPPPGPSPAPSPAPAPEPNLNIATAVG